MKATTLRKLLKQIYSDETLRNISSQAYLLACANGTNRWYFLLVNQIFASLGNHPTMHDADRVEPILESIRQRTIEGIDALESLDGPSLTRAADALTDAFNMTADL